MSRRKYALINVASYLPEWAIAKLLRRNPPDPETFEGFWFDASYTQFMRRNP